MARLSYQQLSLRLKVRASLGVFLSLVSNVQRSRRHRRKTNDVVETKFFVEKETQMWSDAAKKKKSGQKFPPRLVGLRAASAEQESMMAGSHHFSWESGWKEGSLATTEFD